MNFFRFLILLYTVLVCCSCNNIEEKNAETFRILTACNANLYQTLPLDSPDIVVRRIRNEVPPQLYGTISEGVYYHLKEGTADSLIFQYLDLFEKEFKHDSILTFTKTLRGKLLYRQDRYDTAMTCLKEAYSLGRKINSSYRLGDVKAAMGALYTRQRNYPEAIRNLLEAYSLYSETELASKNGALFEMMIKIGNAYQSGNDYSSAKVWFLRAWDFSNKYEAAEGFKIGSAAALANNYLHLNQLDSAKVMIDTAFYYEQKYQKFYDAASRHYILAKILLAQNHCREALSHFKIAQKENLKTNDLIIVNHYNEGMGDGYLCVGQLDSAIAFYQKALATPDTAQQAVIYAQLSKIYAQQGDFKRAYQQEQESHHLSEKTFTIEKDKAIGRLQAENELEKREQQVAEEISQNKMSRLSMIIGLLILSMLLIVGLNIVTRQKQEAKLAAQEKELLQKEKQLVEAREELKTKALMLMKKKLDDKEQALDASIKQLDLKDIIIQKLEIKLTANNQDPVELIQDSQLQNLKILTTEDWRKFRSLFEQYRPHFILNLVERYPKLTGSELRLLVLIKIGFDTVEMANVLGISTQSVYKNRYRLRKKLGLLEEDDLENFARDI